MRLENIKNQNKTFENTNNQNKTFKTYLFMIKK